MCIKYIGSITLYSNLESVSCKCGLLVIMTHIEVIAAMSDKEVRSCNSLLIQFVTSKANRTQRMHQWLTLFLAVHG